MKLLCKKDYFSQFRNKLIWKKNQYYSILREDDVMIEITCEEFHYQTIMKNYKNKYQLFYSEFDDYFYSEKEIRKMKLKKLENENR